MKIVHVITGLEDGGAEGVLFRLVANDNSNHHVVISLTDMGKYGDLLSNLHIEIYCVDMKQNYLIFSLYNLYKLMRKLQPDVVQTWMYHADLIGGLVAKICKVKKIFWNIRHSTIDSGHTRKSTVLIAKINAYFSRFLPNKIVCCAQSALDIHKNIGYKSSIMTVIPNGYDFHNFNINQKYREEFRKDFCIERDDFLIGMVARYNPQKDHKNLLKAFRLLLNTNKCNKIKLMLIGSSINTKNQELVSIIECLDLSKNVVLLGPRDDINIVMNGLDLHVLSSYAGEGFPNVIAEAMACGTPCISTDVGDAKYIVENCGWIVEPRSHLELKNSMENCLKIYENDKEWSNLCISAHKQIINNYDITSMISKYNNVWES